MVTPDGQYPSSSEAEMMKQMSLSDGYPPEQQQNSGLPNNQGYPNNPPMMNKEHQTWFRQWENFPYFLFYVVTWSIHTSIEMFFFWFFVQSRLYVPEGLFYIFKSGLLCVVIIIHIYF